MYNLKKERFILIYFGSWFAEVSVHSRQALRTAWLKGITDKKQLMAQQQEAER